MIVFYDLMKQFIRRYSNALNTLISYTYSFYRATILQPLMLAHFHFKYYFLGLERCVSWDFKKLITKFSLGFWWKQSITDHSPIAKNLYAKLDILSTPHEINCCGSYKYGVNFMFYVNYYFHCFHQTLKRFTRQ